MDIRSGLVLAVVCLFLNSSSYQKVTDVSLILEKGRELSSPQTEEGTRHTGGEAGGVQQTFCAEGAQALMWF